MTDIERGEIERQLALLRLNKAVERESDDMNRVYRFRDTIHRKSVQKCVKRLALWDREEDNAPWTIVLNSPGGYTEDGFELFDDIVSYSLRGGGNHEVTIKVRGEACSMAPILLQAADKRVMGANALIMLHEASSGLYGSYGDHLDTTDMLQKMTERFIEILADRSSVDERIWLSNVHRKDWWLDAEQALLWRLVDEIG